MCLETTDNASVVWLNVGGHVRFEILHPDALKTTGNDMTQEIVLPQEDLLLLKPKCCIPFQDPLLIQNRCHPSFRIVAIVETQLVTKLPSKCTWSLGFPNDKGVTIYLFFLSKRPLILSYLIFGAYLISSLDLRLHGAFTSL